MTPPAPIPVIDLFAGPGGLGEGFTSLPAPGRDTARRAFRIALSILPARRREYRRLYGVYAAMEYAHGIAAEEPSASSTACWINTPNCCTSRGRA